LSKIFDLVKARPDRKDPNKTHWDPLGILFVTEDAEGNMKMYGNVFAIGEVNAFPRKPKDDNPFA